MLKGKEHSLKRQSEHQNQNRYDRNCGITRPEFWNNDDEHVKHCNGKKWTPCKNRWAVEAERWKLRKDEKETPEMKATVTEIKDASEGLMNTLDKAEERVRENFPTEKE